MIRVQLADLAGNILKLIDGMTRAIVTIDYVHHEIHDGSHYLYTDSVEIASGSTQDYLIETANSSKWAHMLFTLDGSAITQFQLYGDTDKSGTTLQNVGNSNRNSTAQARTLIYKGTSGGTTDGTLLYQYKGGSATGVSSRGGAATRNDDEIILKQNAKYILRVTSGTNNNLTNVNLSWYEH